MDYTCSLSKVFNSFVFIIIFSDILACITVIIFISVGVSDPCSSYSVLDNPWRVTSNRYASVIYCDQDVTWSGWYRFFINNISTHIPETCVDTYSCGTNLPMWINDRHPTVGDGIVSILVCTTWSNNCCFHTHYIRVKACPDNYYVYELVRPFGCHFAYCAGNYIHSISVCSPHSRMHSSFIYDPCFKK
uniref:UMOD/GP2/OIT3-like D8C domain-containing protein n=1 Tax=Cyprinus carpio TaxID=7962 RepID=A0A8C1X1P9_CYPCA